LGKTRKPQLDTSDKQAHEQSSRLPFLAMHREVSHAVLLKKVILTFSMSVFQQAAFHRRSGVPPAPSC
jgi:hypothetical protein